MIDRGIVLIGLLALAATCAESYVWNARVTRRHGYIRREQFLADPQFQLGYDSPAEQFFTQPLDHFDAENHGTYQQRYFVNESFWDRANHGPVFLFIGGEGAESSLDAYYGHHMEMAKLFGALVVVVEHRYYGDSVPGPDLSTPNMRYLASQQSLADLATFHSYFSQKMGLTRNNPWISFGGSYPGSLSAWFRLKYPHLVYGAVASSAPVLAQNNFQGYNNVVAASLASAIVGGSALCAEQTRIAFEALRAALSNSSRLAELDKRFNTCSSLTNASAIDITNFVSNIGGIFQGVVQYNNEVHGLNIEQICSIMTAPNVSPLDNLQTLSNKNSGGACVTVSFADYVAELQKVEINPWGSGGERTWLFQTCTQFGYYQTCDAGTDCVFASPDISLEWNLHLCKELFNISADVVQARIDFTNAYYGGDMPDGNRILFVNGDIDPWHALSVLKPIPGTTQNAILIHGTAHCADMQSSSPRDPPELTEGRRAIQAQVGQWILQAKRESAAF